MKAKTSYLCGGWTGCNLSVWVHGWLWLYSIPHCFIPESKGLDGAKVQSPPRVHTDQNINVTAGTQKAAPHTRAVTGLFASLETALSLTQAGRRTTRWEGSGSGEPSEEQEPDWIPQLKLLQVHRFCGNSEVDLKSLVCFMWTKIDHFSGKHYHDVIYQQRKNIVRKHFKNMFRII